MGPPPNPSIRPRLYFALLGSLSLLLSSCTPVVPSVRDYSELHPGPTVATKIHYAQTDDGWNLALHHFPPSGNKVYYTPVVLCHGLGWNSAFWDFSESMSLARYLSKEGFDVWNVDFRGAGASHKPSSHQTQAGSPSSLEDWTLDDVIHLDIPTILQFVTEKTHRDEVSMIGHGLGASVISGFLVTHYSSAIKNYVAIGLPLTFPQPSNAIITKLAKQKDPAQLGTVLNGRWDVRGQEGEWVELQESLRELFAYVPNMGIGKQDRLRRRAVERLPLGVLEQFLVMIQSDEFHSFDRRTSYAQHLEKITAASFLIAGKMDNFASLVNVYDAFGRISSTDKTLRVFQRANGESTEYGNEDLILGKKAPREVYPAITKWLGDRS